MLAVKARRGFTLLELIVAIAVLSVVGGAICEGLRRQQQVFRSIALMIAARSDVRDAGEVLATDILSASPIDTLPVTSDSAVEFSSTIGVTISCDSAPGYTIRIPPERLASGLQLTALLATPDSNDLVLIFNDDSAATAGQPRWERHTIASVSSQGASTACPSSTGFTSAGDGAAATSVIALRTAASGGILRGAPIRIVRRGRYSLYRSSDSRWYLGQRRCDPLGPSSCRPIQPVSGPYAGYSPAGGSGVSFEYFDAAGTALTSWDAGSRVARIGVVVRGRSQVLPRFGRSSTGNYADSSATSVALRNRE
ncbi:MAG: type II secretion system GspH family protein [Gemmatimonadaceae bacterium]|nr:type II secretion system GspH family protein [Gemmatimonadaceae bacterium]